MGSKIERKDGVLRNTFRPVVNEQSTNQLDAAVPGVKAIRRSGLSEKQNIDLLLGARR